ELAGTTGDTADKDVVSGTLTFTDVDLNDAHTVGNSLVSATWSGGATLPSGLSTVLASALTTSVSSDSTGSGSGSIAFTFSAADNTFDFLAAGERLTVIYNVTVTDETGGLSPQPLTSTIIGSTDGPVLAADAFGSHTIGAGSSSLDSTSGTLSFTVPARRSSDLVGNSLVSATWSGGATLPSGLS